MLFLYTLKKNWLQNWPSDFKPHYYRWYVDEIFVLFISPEHIEAFRNFLNIQLANMSFTIENEMQKKVLDVQIIREDETF